MSCIIGKTNKLIVAVLTICFMLIAMPKQIYAAQNIAISIPVSQTLTIQGQSQNQYQSTYQLKALDNQSPMPENSQNKSYYFTMSNNDETTIDIRFTHAGIFSYQLSQVINDTNNQMTYDDTEYQLDVYVKNTSDGGLIASVVAYLENGNKTGEIQFHNELNLTTPPTDDGTDDGDINVTVRPATPGGQATPGATATQGGVRTTGGQTTGTTGGNTTDNQNITDEDIPVSSQIDENQLPLAGTVDHWALVNLICAILAVIIAIINLLWKHQSEDENSVTTRSRWIKISGAIVAVVSVVVFVMTENMSLAMTIVDQWTILMVILAVLNIVILVINGLWKKTTDNK